PPISPLVPYTTLFRSHAVGGGAVHLKGAVRPSRGVQRTVQRERVRRAALLPIGSDHGHLSQGGAHFTEHGQAAGEDAVVVRDERSEEHTSELQSRFDL